MHRRNALGPEAGTTLIELLVTVAILGIAVVAIVAGMATSIIGTDVNRKQAQARTVLVSATDAVKSNATNAYQDCATPASYNPINGVSLPSGWTASNVGIVDVRFWDGAGWSNVCSPDSKLQLVQVRVASADSRAAESASVVKRNPS